MKKIFKSVGIAIEALAAPHVAFGGAAEGATKKVMIVRASPRFGTRSGAAKRGS
jgi:hypothetical protein